MLRGGSYRIIWSYSCLIKCYQNDRMYEQRGFAPPSLPLPIHAGLFLFLNWHSNLLPPCSSLSTLPPFFSFHPSKARRLLWLATTCIRVGLNTPHGLPLWASTHNARSATCMHGSRGRDSIRYNGLERIACCRESGLFLLLWLRGDGGGVFG